MEMRRSTDFQIQDVLRLDSAAVFWSLCFYEDNHLTGQQTGMVCVCVCVGGGHEAAGSYKRSGEGFSSVSHDSFIVLIKAQKDT